MKKLTLAFALIFGVLTSCQEDPPPPEKPGNSDLIIGTWQSTVISERKYTQGQLVLNFDTPDENMEFIFTGNSYFYSSYEGVALDTARYNFEGDSLYLIENARAYDTLYISLLDQENLHLILDVSTMSGNGITLKEETVAEFIRVPDEQ